MRARLPAVRRKFILTEDQSRQLPADADAPPALTRGMIIDVRLGALVNSVTTALDEYRALASILEEEVTDTAPSFEVDATAPDALDAIAASQRVEDELSRQVDELGDMAEPTSATADDLRRQMRDTRVLLSLARIELQMPAFVPRWYRKTIDTVRDYPRILRGTAKAIQLGVDVARPLSDAWNRFSSRLSDVTLDSIEEAATGLRTVADKWDAERTGEEEPDRSPPEFDIDAAHAMIRAGEAPPVSWRLQIENLNFRGEALRDISPLSGLAALKSINLEGNPVEDISVLSDMTSVWLLDLDGTMVRDISALSRMTSLQNIYLNRTRVTDISPLSNLTKLKTLFIYDTPISDLRALAGLINLETLYASGSNVFDISAIYECKSMKHLNIVGTRVSDVSALAKLAALEILDLGGTQVHDVSVVGELRADPKTC